MKRKTKNSEKSDKLYFFLKSKQYGEIVYHSELEEILGVSHNLNIYSGYLRNVKTKLVLHSKILKAIPGVGYQVLKPNQVSSYTYRQYINRTLNMYNFSEYILQNLDTSNLSKDRKDEYKEVSSLNDSLKQLSQKTIKESKYYSRKDYYDSLKEG